MLWRDVAVLVDVEAGTDDDGHPAEREIGRTQVFVDVQSVKRRDYYAAKQDGTDLAITFLVRAVDYSGESRIEHVQPGSKKPTAYRVMRDYTRAGEIYEINCALETVPGSVARKGISWR